VTRKHIDNVTWSLVIHKCTVAYTPKCARFETCQQPTLLAASVLSAEYKTVFHYKQWPQYVHFWLSHYIHVHFTYNTTTIITIIIIIILAITNIIIINPPKQLHHFRPQRNFLRLQKLQTSD